MDNIKNKTVLITGAASGMGLDYSKKLLQNGAKAVAMLDLSSSPGQVEADKLEKEFGKGKVVFYACDVSNTKLLEETFKKAWNTFNGLDIIINNAAVFDENEWEKTMRVNVGGVVQGSLLALDYMGKHRGGKGGTIVNIASIVPFHSFDFAPNYTASKHHVLGFSSCIEKQFDKTEVRVLVMCPGLTRTPLPANFIDKLADYSDKAKVREFSKGFPYQSIDNVGDAMMHLIQKGKNGAVWVSENSEPPYAVELPPFKKIELKL